MKSFYLKFTKQTFLTLFLGISLLFASQGMQAATITSTAAGGDWNSTSTWEGGVIPANSTADYVIILGTATVNLTLTANFSVGALDINQGGKLNVSQDATARSFTLGVLTPGSTIAGALLFDATVSGTKSFGKVTVTATGSVIETTKTSISINNGANGVLTNYGTITTGTLAMSGTGGSLMKIYNYGTINATGFSSTTVGTFTNYSTGTFNYTGATIPAAMTFTASETGNTVNYSGSSQTVRIPTTGSYSNLILSGSGTKTLYQPADTTVEGNLTVNSGVTLRVSSASVSSSVAIPTANGGTLYTVAPTVVISGGTNTGGVAASTGVAILTSGVVTSVAIAIPGSGYTVAPTISFTGGTFAGGTAATSVTAPITAIPTAYKFTVNGTTTNNGTINFDSFAGSGDKTFATFNNSGSITSSITPAAKFVFTTADYSGAAAQTVLSGTYTNLTLSGSGEKTINTTASTRLCLGTFTISGTATAKVSNTNVIVTKLNLGGSEFTSGSYGFTGSAATNINTTYFSSGTGYITVKPDSITSTAVGGDWNSTTTWEGGVIPSNSSTDYVIILGTATVNLNMTAATTVGALKINAGGTLNVTGNFTFTMSNLSPYSNIAGTLNITGTASRTIDNLTVDSTGTISSTGGATSIGTNATLPWVNNGTVTLATLGLTSGKTITNNGTFTCGMGSTSTGIFNNIIGATLNLNGTVAGTVNNYGTMNSTGLSGTAAVANVNNKATGVLNFTGSAMSATNLVLNASEAGNTVNYSGSISQTVKDVAYSNLTLSTSGTKTINTASGTSLCTGTLTISGTAKASVTNTNVGVEKFYVGTTGQTSGTHGYTGSGATTINTANFANAAGTLNVQQNLDPNIFTSTALGGDWNTASTWVGGIVPSSSTATFVTIAENATVTLNLTSAFTVGALNINQGGKLNVSSTGANAFTLGIKLPYSTISGELNFDNTVTATKSLGNITVTSTGLVNTAIGATSIASNATAPWVNNGTISMVTLGLSTGKTIDNNGTFTCTGIGSTSQGIFNNNSGAVFNLTGAVAGTINNYGTINSSQLTGTAAVANITNLSTGILNFSGQGMYSTTLVLNATTPGNVVNYNLEGDQLIKPTSYTNLSLTGAGNKNISSGATLTIPVDGVLTIGEGVNLNNSGIINNLGTITNNGNLVQRSFDLGSGILLSTSSINNVTQQRYFASNQRGWRLISNPLSATTFSALATDSGISLGTNFTGEYVSSTNTWTSTDATATLDTQKAYKVFITGLTGESPSYTAGPSNVTLVNKGTAANTEPATINTVAGEYYLVANPYTAPVSVASILAASTNLSSTVSYYNPANSSADVKIKAGGYDFPIVSGVAGSDTDVVIPPMGAIFVLATENGTINVPKSAIFTGIPAQTGNYNQKNSSNK